MQATQKSNAITQTSGLLYQDESISSKRGGPLQLHFFPQGIAQVKEFFNSEKFKVQSPRRDEDSSFYFIREKDLVFPLSIKAENEFFPKVNSENEISALANKMRSLKVEERIEVNFNREKWAETHKKNSYARATMAYYRAHARRDLLIEHYKTIFDKTICSLKSGKENILISVYCGNKNYNEYSELSLNDNCSLSLKKVFEILQVFHFVEKNPILIKLNIGGVKCEFMVSAWPTQPHADKNQVLVSVKEGSSSYHYEGHAYSDLIKGMLGNSVDSKLLAQALTTCLDCPANEQPETLSALKLNSGQTKSVAEFLAVTQIAESAYGPSLPYSRTPGMNKVARMIIRGISEGNYSWRAFTSSEEQGAYPPIGKGGTKRARDFTAVSRQSSGHYASAGNMSDDSDDEKSEF